MKTTSGWCSKQTHLYKVKTKLYLSQMELYNHTQPSLEKRERGSAVNYKRGLHFTIEQLHNQ